MLISAAVCPHPPILVPAVAGEAAPELDGLRAACDEAVRRLGVPVLDASIRPPRLRGLASAPDAVFVVGGGPETRAYGPDVTATLRPYGADLAWGTGPELPLSLTIGHWLLARAGIPAHVRYQSVAWDAEPAECLELGRELAGAADGVALLVLGDGPACLSEKAPGYLDERGASYDEAVADALGRGDAAALARLDAELSRDLQAAGRAAWQVLAGAAGASRPSAAERAGGADDARGRAGGGRYEAERLARTAPYGVGYHVASWRRSEAL